MSDAKMKTDAALIERLEKAAKRKLTKKEIEAQRLSFIYSGMPHESSMSKIKIKRVLKQAS